MNWGDVQSVHAYKLPVHASVQSVHVSMQSVRGSVQSVHVSTQSGHASKQCQYLLIIYLYMIQPPPLNYYVILCMHAFLDLNIILYCFIIQPSYMMRALVKQRFRDGVLYTCVSLKTKENYTLNQVS